MLISNKFREPRIIVLLICTFCFIVLWNIANTIAGRYIFSGLALLLVLSLRLDWRKFFSTNKIFLIFVLYLLVHLFFLNSNFQESLRAFRGEWLKLILFLILGAGLGLTFVKRPKYNAENLILFIGLAFCAPLVLYLFLLINKISIEHAIPWGYFGVGTHHGDLGYTSFGASLLLSPILFVSNNKKNKILASLGLIICLTSVLFAQSRGGLIFTILPILLLALYFTLKHLNSFKIVGIISICVVALLFGVMQFSSLNHHSKWSGMIERATFGFIGNDALEINCKGPEYIKELLKQQGKSITPEYEALINATVDGDGARVLTARGAIRLSLLNPLGFNESKDSYQLALTKYCGGKPLIMLSNAHNGWLNAALAIGIPGALLYLLVMLNFAKQGWQQRYSENRLTAITLILVVGLWIVRSLLDATIQDQMLEMQVFIMAFLAALLLNTHDKAAKN